MDSNLIGDADLVVSGLWMDHPSGLLFRPMAFGSHPVDVITLVTERWQVRGLKEQLVGGRRLGPLRRGETRLHRAERRQRQELSHQFAP